MVHCNEGVKDMKVEKTEEEWKKILDKKQYSVLREKGTEMPFSGEYWDKHDDGTYHCAGCGALLFDSKDKFDSGSGWPSFTRPVDTTSVVEEIDTSHGMRRQEVICNNCGGHLGHVFPDGPKRDGGLRYCINSISLDFKTEQE